MEKIKSQLIIDYVVRVSGISIDIITGKSQVREICNARGLLCAALSKYSDMSFPEILKMVNRTDNAVSSLIVNVRKTERWRELCEEVKRWK